MTAAAPPPITVSPDTAASPGQAMEALKNCAAEYAEAQRKRDETLDALRQAIVSADRTRAFTRNELIAAAGIGRQTVYDALNAAAKS